MGQHTGRVGNEEGVIKIYVGRADPIEVAYLRLRVAELEQENNVLKQKLKDLAWDAIVKSWSSLTHIASLGIDVSGRSGSGG